MSSDNGSGTTRLPKVRWRTVGGEIGQL